MRYYQRGLGEGYISLNQHEEKITVGSLVVSRGMGINHIQNFIFYIRTFHVRVHYGDTKGVYRANQYSMDDCLFDYQSLINDLAYNQVSVLLLKTKWEF